MEAPEEYRFHHRRRRLGRLRSGQSTLGRPANKVLLLEAGRRDRSPWVHMPGGYYKLIYHPQLSWNFKSAPEPHLNGREMIWPRGRVLGGSSSINAMVYIRGQAQDFDMWRQRGCVRLGLCGCAPVLQARGGSESGRIGVPRHRWPTCRVGSGRTPSAVRCVHRGWTAIRLAAQSGLQWREPRGRWLFSVHRAQQVALQHSRRLSAASRGTQQPSGHDRRHGHTAHHRGPASAWRCRSQGASRRHVSLSVARSFWRRAQSSHRTFFSFGDRTWCAVAVVRNSRRS